MEPTYQDFLTEDPHRPGVLRFGGARMALLDIEAGLWGLRRQIEALVGPRLADAVFQQAGANGGASFARSFVGQRTGDDGRRALRDCVAAYQAAGFGRFEIEVLEWPVGRVVVRAWDTFEAWMVRQHGRQAERPVCAYSAGVLVGFVNVLAGRTDVVCIQHACQAQGADACLFELLPAEATGDVPVVAFAPDPALGRQLNLLEILFDRMPVGIAIFDRDLRLRRCNPTWAGFIDRYTPSTAGQVVPGAHFFDLAPGTEEEAMPIFKRVLAGETVHLDGMRLESGGIVSYWDVVFTPLIEDGEVVGFVDVTTDATERVLAYQELEERVEARTRELSTLLEVVRAASGSLELDEVLRRVAQGLASAVGVRHCGIYVMDDERGLLVPAQGADSDSLGPEFAAAFRGGALDPARDPFTREVIETRRPVVCHNAEADPRTDKEVVRLLGLKSILAVPFVVKGRVVAVAMLATFDAPYDFTEKQIELAQGIANTVALTVENARLYRAEQERRRELQTLLDVVATASSSLNLDEMLAKTLDRLVALVGASRAGVMLLDGETGDLKPRMIRPDRSIAPEDMAEMVQACRAVIASGEPLHVPVDEARGHLEPGALLPLRARGRALGVLVIVGPEGGAFSREQRALFESIADQLGVAVENARLYEQAERVAAAAERSRLARDLHDAVTQTLFSASLIAEVLPRIWERDPVEGQRRLEELRQLTRGALAEMRTLLLELRPSALVEAELGDLLRQLAESITGRARVEVVLRVEGECSLPPDVKVAFYRIAQEALNNVARHAGASRAEVRLRCEPGRVDLRISDDGRGFDPETVPPESLGLGIMRERAAAVGAALRVKSEIGRGTEVVVEWVMDDGRRTIIHHLSSEETGRG